MTAYSSGQGLNCHILAPSPKQSSASLSLLSHSHEAAQGSHQQLDQSVDLWPRAAQPDCTLNMQGHSLPLFTLSTHTLNNTGGGDDCCNHDPTHPASATASAVQTALLRMLAHASPQNQPYVHVPLPAWLGILPAQPTTAQPGGPMQHTTKRRTRRPPDCVHQATTILTNRTTRTTNSTTALRPQYCT